MADTNIDKISVEEKIRLYEALQNMENTQLYFKLNDGEENVKLMAKLEASINKTKGAK